MLSSLLKPDKGRKRAEHSSNFSSPYDRSSPAAARRERLTMPARYASADFVETDGEDENTEDEAEEDVLGRDDEGADMDQDDGEDGVVEEPLLPIFSAAHLDAIPIYNLTHAIRLIVLPRTETTLTWDQLRSPQVSQFLVKPMQQQICTSHFNRATLYALMANCLQFRKESQANPAIAGNSNTQAMVCELLAIKLLKEYNTRELIDALSYDFFPLQGLGARPPSTPRTAWDHRNGPKPAAARISTLEVAIRASAKKFLAHPSVVKQLEAIWAGNIVFHSAADSLHRRKETVGTQHREPRIVNDRTYLLVPENSHTYGGTRTPARQTLPDKSQPLQHPLDAPTRRTATLYDPRDASVFKLSRLRVPRYRQLFSTCSLAILLCLFIAVLIQRSTEITDLEVIFWFWSAGFMLDEVVGFNEQGFSLYLMSFWNTFDLGILLFLGVYYCMRLYGLFLVDYGRDEWNGMAYDVLATNAILLFPRLFSVLDHYRYFSQLLIAFRLMAIDLLAVLVLVLITCSGFLVAFTLSFGAESYNAAEVAYQIFQILMGFTPAAWDAWPKYNILGKSILTLFLFICHFLVVTILITVLTNSFMAIVSNANEEHQFVFAVNTISMVKNDALFSYVAPTNLVAWILTPLRFILPFRQFLKLNRTMIKATHFPLLFGIYAYEKMVLASSVFEATDLVEKRGRRRVISFQDMQPGLFSPNVRMRQESVSAFQKDKALDEVFRLAPRGETLRIMRKGPDTQTHHAVSNWMDRQSGTASPPQEQDHAIVDRLERRRARTGTLLTDHGLARQISAIRSVASDPAEFMSTAGFYDTRQNMVSPGIVNHTDEDGDDELDKSTSRHQDDAPQESEEEDYFQTPAATRNTTSHPSTSFQSRQARVPKPTKPSPPQPKLHRRNISTGTILFNPLTDPHPRNDSSTSPPKPNPFPKRHTGTNSGSATQAGSRTPKHGIAQAKPRPIMPSRRHFQSVPNIHNLLHSPKNHVNRPSIRHRRSSLDICMSEIDLDINHAGPMAAVPSSFTTQMAMANAGKRREDADGGMMGRLMLARMKTLEEGFAEVVREFRGMSRTAGNSSVEGSVNFGGMGGELRKDRERERGKKRKANIMPSSRDRAEANLVMKGQGKENERNVEGEEVQGEPDKNMIGRRYTMERSSS